ncbi:MAG: hypothetical protein EXR70_20230 [Deltaproteobacteria bacterium]|nr:hypothetical protein [Deltaproteobacteria bacterium]
MGNAIETLKTSRSVIRWPQLRTHALPLIGVFFTVWLIVVPLFTLLVFSFRLGTPWQPGAFTLQHYLTAYSDPQVYLMFFNTVILAATSTTVALAIAVFFAFLTERTDMPFRNLAWGLMLVPMAVPGIFFAISWVFLLSPQIGLINI